MQSQWKSWNKIAGKCSWIIYSETGSMGRTMHSRLSMFWIIHRLINIKLRKVIGLSSYHRLPTMETGNEIQHKDTHKNTHAHHFLCVCHFMVVECENVIFVFEVVKLRQISAYLRWNCCYFCASETEWPLPGHGSMRTFKQISVFFQFRRWQHDGIFLLEGQCFCNSCNANDCKLSAVVW